MRRYQIVSFHASRTISGKISEIAVRETIHGQPVKNTDALVNPGTLDAYVTLRGNLNS